MGIQSRTEKLINDFGENTMLGRAMNDGLGQLLDAHDKRADNKVWKKFERVVFPKMNRLFDKDIGFHKYNEVMTVMTQADLLGRVEQPAKDLQSALTKIRVPEDKRVDTYNQARKDPSVAYVQLEKNEIIALQNGSAILSEMGLRADEFLNGEFKETQTNRKEYESSTKEYSRKKIQRNEVEMNHDFLRREDSFEDVKVEVIKDFLFELAGEVSHYNHRLDGKCPINHVQNSANEGLYNDKYKVGDLEAGYMPYPGYGHPEIDHAQKVVAKSTLKNVS